MSEPDTGLVDAARSVLARNLGVGDDETLLVVSDTVKREIGHGLFEAGVDLDLEAGLVEMIPRDRGGQEPPPYVEAAMREADVVVCPTSASLTHTRAREAATDAGARVATMPGVTEEMFHRGAMTADHAVVERLSAELADHLTAAGEARIEARGRTFTVDLGDREGIASDGVIRTPGEWGNLPSGEAYLAPVEDTATGALVFDGSVAGLGDLDDPLLVEIEDGSIVDASGDHAGEFLASTEGHACARRVCELGIGTNPGAEVTGNVLEDEKVYGTCHVAFGDNRGFGGTVVCDSHRDGILLEPDLYLDGERVVSGGEVLLEA